MKLDVGIGVKATNAFKVKTRVLRHKMVRIVAPNLYKDYILRIIPRPMIQYVYNHSTENSLVGVEIGVAEGCNAENMLKLLPISKLYLIDPWQPYVDSLGYLIHADEWMEKAKKQLAPYNNRIEIMQKTSEEAAKEIPNNLDFVYIDGHHGYDFVKKDIALYYPKVKRGGVIGGHDFYWRYKSVCRAAEEFAKNENLVLHIGGVDWWVIKT